MARDPYSNFFLIFDCYGPKLVALRAKVVPLQAKVLPSWDGPLHDGPKVPLWNYSSCLTELE